MSEDESSSWSECAEDKTVVIWCKRSTQTLEGRNLPDRPSLLIPYRCGKRNIEIFAPCMRVDVEPSNLERARGARVVTTRHRKQSGRNTLCHQPPPPLGPLSSSASTTATLSNQSLPPARAFVGCSLKAKEMHRALSSSSSYGEQRPGTSLGYDVDPYQNDSSPACAATRTWQPADASTQSGSATLVSQQLQHQHRAAAAYTTHTCYIVPSVRQETMRNIYSLYLRAQTIEVVLVRSNCEVFYE